MHSEVTVAMFAFSSILGYNSQLLTIEELHFSERM